MPKKGGRRRKTRTHVKTVDEAEKNRPKSFVFKRGKVPPLVQELVQDMRRVMEPYTATNLKDKRNNSVKDFIKIAAPLGVSHFMFFTSTENSTHMKIARLPRGPTLSFQVTGYSLIRHIRSTQKRPIDASNSYRTFPLVVLNNFKSDENHIKLLNVTFQNMFPSIDVQTVKLSECRRVVLFNYEKETDTVEFRQYLIRANPVGISSSVKRIVKAKLPNLSKVEDISDYILGTGVGGGGMTSDSEVEDESTQVTLPDDFAGRGNIKREKSAIKLHEIGPRLTLKLVKVEREICEGDVLYHAFQQKSAEDAARDKAKREAALALKKRRREEQEKNVQQKQEAKAEKVARKKARKAGKEDEKDDVSDLDDAEYYRQQVGEEPDEHLFADKKKPKN